MTACFIDSDLEHDNFLNTDISQGSVVIQCVVGYSLVMCCRFITESVSERIVKIISTFGEVMGKIILACFFI